jgi:hypothetical protein
MGLGGGLYGAISHQIIQGIAGLVARWVAMFAHPRRSAINCWGADKKILGRLTVLVGWYQRVALPRHLVVAGRSGGVR